MKVRSPLLNNNNESGCDSCHSNGLKKHTGNTEVKDVRFTQESKKFCGSPTFDLALNHELGFQWAGMGFHAETGQEAVKAVQGTIQKHRGA